MYPQSKTSIIAGQPMITAIAGRRRGMLMMIPEPLQSGAKGRPLLDPTLQVGRLWNRVERPLRKVAHPSAQLNFADLDQWGVIASCAGSVKS